MILDGSTDLCLSGGAVGADLMWGMCAGKAGHAVVHWSFLGHRSLAPPSEVAILPDHLLAEADPYLTAAASVLRRHYPPRSPYVRKLLQRNWFQIAHARAVYAVAGLESQGTVSGGTGWAVQMFIARNGDDAPVYVFDQGATRWVRWRSRRWEDCTDVPVPHGIWAGIGSRELSDAGKQAIRELLGYCGSDLSSCGTT